MKRSRLLQVLIAALLLVAWTGASPAAAAVQQCGQPPAADATGDPVIPTLTTKDAESRLAVPLDDGFDSFIFVFDVKGCSFSSNDGVSAKVRASTKVKAALGTPEITADGTLLIVEVPVDPKKMPAGKSSASVTISGAAVPESYITVTATKKASFWKLAPVALIALLVGWGSTLVAAYNAASGDDNEAVDFKWGWAAVALVAAAVAALAPIKVGYYDKEVWAGTSGDLITLGIAIGTTTGGAAVAGRALKAFKKKTA